YQKWPFPISDSEVQQDYYLRSLSPKEELAVFLSLRGQVLRFHGRSIEALLSCTQANLLHPNHPDLAMGLAIASQQQTLPIGRMPEATLNGQVADDANAVWGLKCYGWQALMIQEFHKAALEDVHKGEFCF